MKSLPVRFLAALALTLACVAGVRVVSALQGQPANEPPRGPRIFDTMDYKIRVVTVADGLAFPYSIAFLPDGSALITQLDGKIRVIKNGVLTPTPIGPIPGVYANAVPGPAAEGMMDIALHP